MIRCRVDLHFQCNNQTSSRLLLLSNIFFLNTRSKSSSSFFFFFFLTMALLRSMSQLKVKAPPPSPIPTAAGSRSAANQTLSEFLEKSLQVPDLITLSESQDLLHDHHHSDPPPPPYKVDFESLALRERSSVELLLRSAREWGVVRIGWHGIDTEEEELTALVKEAARVFGVLEERDAGFRRYRAAKREEIVWVRCKDERMEWARQYIGPVLYQSFRYVTRLNPPPSSCK